MAAVVLISACTGAPSGSSGPGGPGSTPVGTCGLVTATEMSDIFGKQMSLTDTNNNTCTYTAVGGLPSVVVRFEDTDLSKAKSLLGDDAQEVTVSGNPGVIGSLFGVILYVRHNSRDLVIQSVLLDDSQPNRQKVIAVATKALTRLP
jgi:hypothetical protein